VPRCRSCAASLNHPYLALRLPATATWAAANWAEGLHLTRIVTERSSGFALPALKACPALRSGSDTQRGHCMGPRGLRGPLLGGRCCAWLPVLRARRSRRCQRAVPDHIVSDRPTSCLFSLGSDCCLSSTNWAAKHPVLPWFSAGTGELTPCKFSSVWVTVLERQLEAWSHLSLSSLPLLVVACHEW